MVKTGISFLVHGANGEQFTISGNYYLPPIFIDNTFMYKGVRIDFVKFFPYDNGDGQPIYDTETGAELRDPITGL